ncbi:rab-GTPase-TBC domain-containing protein [Bombardia bombarda]|uniref:Rab-GTPase-TBC domain-containing protein n=1 Tax=Bombardia bombarda TaxID=252184 RepID=A0AA39XAY2_9PEZI|nr:rab-GTPase-TBC domain-containing protein [Bombardia bombarda]
MRSLAETKLRWEETLKRSSNIADLRRSVKPNGSESPCLSGCRSVCWKAFLLFQDAPAANWPHILRESRNSYSSACADYLKFIKHPEQLAALPFDPLDDDPDSPWNAARRDELIRDEILQDVRRLPDEPFYHREDIQTMILDILFLYCKLNPSVGGYRQGMHELLAPMVYVVAQDAVDRGAIAVGDPADPVMVEMLDSYYIEHDAYALFDKIMGRASVFYEVDTEAGSSVPEQSTIVEKSRYIHETALMKIDQELASHIKNIEVLPQIFLIRWIRLLFGREFPFEQLLALWDAIFAFDPSLDLIDFICVAMLLRIRWTLLEADYSVALQLLLKYPIPKHPYGPHTFVNDAIYLKDHPTAAGGTTLIFKYTGKSPAASATSSTPSSTTSRPSTPSSKTFGGLRPRTLGAKSPLSLSTRLLQQPGGVEALLQGAAKGVLERGEKFGINQAVRDAMGEIKRNMQGLQEARSSARGSPSLGDNGPTYSDHSLAITMMERRNRRLASMLDESITNLKLLVASKLDGNKEETIEAVETAAAKVQFVKTCLEDSSLALSEEELPSLGALTISTHSEMRSPTVALDTTPVVMTSAVEEARSTLSSPGSDKQDRVLVSLPEEHNEDQLIPMDVDKMDTDDHPEQPISPTVGDNTTGPPPPVPVETIPPATTEPPSSPSLAVKPQRPQGPIPTRSTLAQSSFSWMLEPDTTMSSSMHTPASSFPTSRPPSSGGGGGGISGAQRRRTNASRDRNAFLFGEVTSDEARERKPSTDEIFGLQPIRKGK